MSDAQGSARDPRTGDPIDESADVDSTDAVESATAADAHDAGHHAAHDESASDGAAARSEQGTALADAGGETHQPAGTALAAPDTTAPEPAEPVAVASPEPAPEPEPERAPAADAPAPAGATATPVDNDGDGEPDYAALAAELEEFERRHAAATGTPLTAPEPAGSDAAPRRDPWFEPAETKTFSASEPAAPAEPAVTASEPVVPAPAPVAPQPIFVQAPEPPKLRGNRAASGLIGLVAALVFAVLYAAATIGWLAVLGQVDLSTIGAVSLQLVASASLWVPVIVFWFGFWLLGAIVNRARWGTWVTLGFFVGVVAYGGHLLGQLFAAPFWMLTADQGQALVVTALVSPVAIAAFVIAREITIWFGAWAARRGAKVAAQNAEAQEEYERTLEAGPQLSA